MRCPGCGREIGEQARFCQHCGFRIPGGSQSTQTWAPPIAAPSGEKSHTATVVAVVIVAVVVVLGVILLAAIGLGSNATMNIYVHSTHTLYSVSFVLSVGGKVVHYGTINPLDYFLYTYTYHWSSQDPTSVYVSATSTGGGFGDESDFSYVSVTDGGTYTVNLYI